MKFTPTLHKLSNGVTVLLDPMDLETVNVRVQFGTGARDETADESGITHFCEHMMCRGTPRFPTPKIINDYFDINAGTRNAYSSPQELGFHGRILAENINILIDFLGDQIQNALFLPESIDMERSVIADELRRTLDNPDRQLRYFIGENVFNNTLGYKVLGTFENIETFTREQMLEFLARRLSAKNCIIGISGKIIDAEKVLECLERTFNFLPSFDVSKNTNVDYIPTILHNSKPDRNNIQLRILFPNIWTPDFDNRFNNFCVAKLESFMREELYQIIRHENGLAYGFGLTGHGNEKFELTGFATQTSAENIEKCVALIAKNAYKIYTENTITDDDLDRFNRRNRLGDADWLESAGQRCDKLIGFYHDYGRVYDFYDTVQLSQSIRRDDVIKNSRGYFDGAMSIITQGADFNTDLKSVWDENFK